MNTQNSGSNSSSSETILVNLAVQIAINICDCELCILKISKKKRKNCVHARVHMKCYWHLFSLPLFLSLLSTHFRFWMSISAIFHFLHLFFPRMEFLVKKNANLRKFEWRWWWWRHDNTLFLNSIFSKKRDKIEHDKKCTRVLQSG